MISALTRRNLTADQSGRMNSMTTKMKKIRRAAAFLILAVSLSVFAVSSAANDTGTVFGGWLILRNAPSYSGNIVSSYPSGTVVQITGRSGSWYSVIAPDGMTGYMLGNYLKIQGSGITNGSDAWVTSRNGLNVRLRTGPGTNYSILSSYAPGTKVAIISYGKDWSMIRVGNFTGYMMTRYLTGNNNNSGQENVIPSVGEYDVYVTSRNGKGVNLRMGPSKVNKAIATYDVGTAARMVQYGATWSYIRIGQTYGYMMTEFLTTTKPSGGVPVPSVSAAYVTSANGKSVNLRTGPGKQYQVITSFAVGTPLTVISNVADWCYISIGNYNGYMMRQFIVQGNPGVSNTATPTDIWNRN